MTERSPEQIEREIEQDRANLARTVDDLEDRFSFGNVVDAMGGVMRDGGGDFFRNLSRQVRDNPLPTVLMGVGLAWMMSGGGGRPHMPHMRGRRRTHPDDWGREPLDPYEDPMLGYPPLDPEEPYGVPYGGVGESGGGSDGGRSITERARDRLSGAGEAAGSAAHGIGSGARGAAGAAGSAARGAAGRAGSAVSGAGHAAGSAARGASHAAGSAARGAAYGARRASDAGAYGVQRARRASSEAAEGAADFVDRNPLVSGAIAFAVGAALGGLSPNTRRENALMGDRAERMRHDAGEFAAEEAEKAGRVARAAAEEARRMGDEAVTSASGQVPGGREAVDKAEEKLREAGGRVAKAADEEAERTGLKEDARKLDK